MHHSRDVRSTLAVLLARLSAIWLSTLAAATFAATLTVTGTGDTVAVDGVVTLREAITSINNGAPVNADVVNSGFPYGNTDTILFSIPGAGVHTIAPASPLPALTTPVTIEGYSQPGSSVNTNPLNLGSNAVLLIELNLAGNGASGLVLSVSNIAIRGLVINRSPGPGIALTGSNNLVTGNFIGTNPTGTAPGPGNAGDGIAVSGSNNRIGGALLAERNVVSGNGTAGIRVSGGAGSTVIGGNLIGTNAAGTGAVPNTAQGVVLAGPGGTNIVGRFNVPASASNTISGNGSSGLLIATSTLNEVWSNLIGLDVTGATAVPNQGDGITINAGSNFIGGANPIEGNVVSGNVGNGILINGNANLLRHNRIGTDASGTANVGNGQNGVNVAPFASTNFIGQQGGRGNLIAFNGAPGVQVYGAGATGGTENEINNTSIHSNNGLGIKLGSVSPATPTPNDAGDADTGPNTLQNFPVLTSATRAGNDITNISGTLNSTPNTEFLLEFFASTVCDPSGNGEGQTYIITAAGSALTTDGAGNLSFGPFNAPNVPAGLNVITATARTAGIPSGGTSEFSACFNATGATPSITINDVTQNEGNAGTSNFVFTVTISQSANASAQFTTADGTATSVSDYTAATGTVTFTAGGPTTQTISIQVQGDLAVEPNETFLVNLSGAVGASIADAQGVGTIFNDDAGLPTISITDVTQAEGNAGTSNFVFTVSISSTANATVDFATANGTATAGSDYVANAGTLTFTAGGALTQTVTVVVNGDAVPEISESFVVNLSGATGATIADAQGLGTIVNDDGAPPSTADIPTLGEWPLIALMLLLAALGWRAMRRH